MKWFSDDYIDGLSYKLARCLPVPFSLSGCSGGQHIPASLTLNLEPREGVVANGIWADGSVQLYLHSVFSFVLLHEFASLTLVVLVITLAHDLVLPWGVEFQVTLMGSWWGWDLLPLKCWKSRLCHNRTFVPVPDCPEASRKTGTEVRSWFLRIRGK